MKKTELLDRLNKLLINKIDTSNSGFATISRRKGNEDYYYWFDININKLTSDFFMIMYDNRPYINTAHIFKIPANTLNINNFRIRNDNTMESNIDLEISDVDRNPNFVDKNSPSKEKFISFLIYDFWIDSGKLKTFNSDVEIEKVMDVGFEVEDEYSEGKTSICKINKFERDINARKKCIEKYGHACKICGFKFSDKYGEIGENFIEIHHIVPLHKIGKQYRVNPLKDLIPVCSNCHRMLHRNGKNTLSPDDLREIIEIKKRNF